MADNDERQKILDLFQEGKEFVKIKQKSDTARAEIGSSTYIISKQWLDKYKKYCFYTDAKYSSSPSAERNHLERYNPG